MANFRGTLKNLHRYVALALAVLWLSQALTGLLMAFRWELDDASVAGDAVPVDVAALGARIATVERADRTVTSVWATGGRPDRFDLYVDEPGGESSVVRVDGAGRELRVRGDADGAFSSVGSFIHAAATLHQTLLMGDRGKYLIGVSGLFLLVTIAMGVVLAWPARRGQWRLALWPRAARPGAARRYAWHRAVGLWLAVPAIVVLSAGVLLTFEGPLERALGLDVDPPELQAATAPQGDPVPFAAAARAALDQFPGSSLSGVSMPSSEQAWYRIRVRQPAELRRAYGTSVVYVAASDGRVLLAEDALRAPAARVFMEALYPVHTGEAAGLPGRLVVLSVAAGLLTMLVLGLGLWWIRRRR